jgi:hypothetical protein
MIRAATGHTAIGMVAVLAVGVALCLRPADPGLASPELASYRAERLTNARTQAATALDELAAALDVALQHARTGAARTRSGDLPPAPELEAAGLAVELAAQLVPPASIALTELAGVTASVTPGAAVPALTMGSGDLVVVAGQLRASAEAATAFVERRQATATVNRALADAAEALTDDDPNAAIERLVEGAAAIDLLTGWEQPPETFGFWLETVTELYDAARGIAEATLAGDADAVAEAAARYARASEAARGADNALALALTEGASAVSLTAQRRVANLAAEVQEVRSLIAAPAA